MIRNRRADFKADYGVSAETVYTEYSRMLVGRGQIFAVLQACSGFWVPKTNNPALLLPSWVADLRITSPKVVHEPYLQAEFTFEVHGDELLCCWYILGICHSVESETRTTGLGSQDGSEHASESASEEEVEDRSGITTGMTDVFLTTRGPERSLFNTVPLEKEAKAYWPDDGFSAESMDAVFRLQNGTLQDGDILCAANLPIARELTEFEDVFTHLAYPFLLRAVGPTNGAYRICGQGTLCYRVGSELPHALRTYRIV